jgi:hypothetical protein
MASMYAGRSGHALSVHVPQANEMLGSPMSDWSARTSSTIHHIVPHERSELLPGRRTNDVENLIEGVARGRCRHQRERDVDG